MRSIETLPARRRAAASYYHAHQPGVSYAEACRMFEVGAFDVNDYRPAWRYRAVIWIEENEDAVRVLMILALVFGAAMLTRFFI